VGGYSPPELRLGLDLGTGIIGIIAARFARNGGLHCPGKAGLI